MTNAIAQAHYSIHLTLLDLIAQATTANNNIALPILDHIKNDLINFQNKYGEIANLSAYTYPQFIPQNNQEIYNLVVNHCVYIAICLQAIKNELDGSAIEQQLQLVTNSFQTLFNIN